MSAAIGCSLAPSKLHPASRATVSGWRRRFGNRWLLAGARIIEWPPSAQVGKTLITGLLQREPGVRLGNQIHGRPAGANIRAGQVALVREQRLRCSQSHLHCLCRPGRARWSSASSPLRGRELGVRTR